MAHIIFLDEKKIGEDDRCYSALENAVSVICACCDELNLRTPKGNEKIIHDGTRFDVIGLGSASDGPCLKTVLEAFWKYREGYDGNITAEYLGETKSYRLYSVETESCKYVASYCDLSKTGDISFGYAVIFFTACSKKGKLLVTGEESDRAEYVDLDGVVCRMIPENEYLTPHELAKASGKSVTRVYQIAKKLGRLPTIEELMVERKPTGRPRKY